MQPLQTLISSLATDASMLAMLQNEPESFAEMMAPGTHASAALRSADTLVELDCDPRFNVTLVGTITKCNAKAPDERVPIDLSALAKEDLVRILTIALKDSRYAAKQRTDLKL